jgi:hypothetical protein
MKFSDRADAGRRLAGKLAHLKDRQPVVLALPRGWNDLCLGIERNEGVWIAEPARVVVVGHVALLLTDISPDLIDLDPAAGKHTASGSWIFLPRRRS